MDGQARSREALASFHDYLADKGLMEKNTAQSRKAAVTRVLGILDEAEAADVTNLDIEDVMSRFQRLHGRDYTPASLTSYKSRIRSALDDFLSYLSNPLAFRPSVQSRARARTRSANEEQSDSTKARPERRSDAVRTVPIPAAAGLILPIPIRPNLTVHVQGIPFDLTEAEARKIAAVVTAMVQT
ncbi:MAG TPA: hypothetical protein VGR70_17060 [Stellaceae bacterium]|nr:hypothetical protein [Stellaceae bacterium]